jgi:hypothetical protein
VFVDLILGKKGRHGSKPLLTAVGAKFQRIQRATPSRGLAPKEPYPPQPAWAASIPRADEARGKGELALLCRHAACRPHAATVLAPAPPPPPRTVCPASGQLQPFRTASACGDLARQADDILGSQARKPPSVDRVAAARRPPCARAWLGQRAFRLGCVRFSPALLHLRNMVRPIRVLSPKKLFFSFFWILMGAPTCLAWSMLKGMDKAQTMPHQGFSSPIPHVDQYGQ